MNRLRVRWFGMFALVGWAIATWSGCASTAKGVLSGACVQQCRQNYSGSQEQIACINRCDGR
jgi:hypothetical protein